MNKENVLKNVESVNEVPLSFPCLKYVRMLPRVSQPVSQKDILMNNPSQLRVSQPLTSQSSALRVRDIRDLSYH